ncbi:STAS domain-containing protein [Actinoplanes sp. NPDC049548]|uniref:STAS domain-containing protein n=1 Tax=Actinoplanes sp. NPDC049548 TaxID=3155152 RepID=UPI0034158A1D
MRTISVDSSADGRLTVVLRGDLDFTNASQVAGVVQQAINGGRPASVRIDLAEVTFLDSSGIGLLVRAMKAAEEGAAEFRVTNPNPKVLDQLWLSGLLEAFGLPESTVDP